MITGCGGKLHDLLAQVDQVAHLVDERHHDVEAGGQRLLVLAEALDDAGPRLRDDPHRLGQQHDDEQEQQRQQDQHDRHGVLLSGSGRLRSSRLGIGVDVGGGAADLEDLDGLARLDGRGSRRTARPIQISPASLIRPGSSAVICSVTTPCWPTSLPWPSRRSGPLCSRLTRLGPHQRQHRDRGRRPRPGPGATQGGAERGGHHAGEGADGEHEQDQVEAEHLGHAQQDRQAEPGLPRGDRRSQSMTRPYPLARRRGQRCRRRVRAGAPPSGRPRG